MSETKWTIWKFPLDVVDEQVIEMPIDARTLSVQMQGDTLTLWAVVLNGPRRVGRRIVIAGTGHPINHIVSNAYAFLGTVQDHRGLVWHVFDAGWMRE